MPGTTITAERVFDKHAVALNLPKMGDKSFKDYVAKYADDEEATRCLTAAFEAAQVADHSDVHTWLAQARQHIKNPFPSEKRR